MKIPVSQLKRFLDQQLTFKVVKDSLHLYLLCRVYLFQHWFRIFFLTKYYYYWASLVAQLVKNPPAVRETGVQSLGWEDPLEKGKAPVFWPGEFHGLYSPWGRKESDTTERLSLHFTSFLLLASSKKRGRRCQLWGNKEVEEFLVSTEIRCHQ